MRKSALLPATSPSTAFFLALLCLGLACDGEEPESAAFTADNADPEALAEDPSAAPAAAPAPPTNPSEVDSQWFGHALGLTPPTIEFVRDVGTEGRPGAMPIFAEDLEDDNVAAPEDDDPITTDNHGATEWVEVTADGAMYVHRWSRAEAAALHDAMRDAGLTSASGFSPDENHPERDEGRDDARTPSDLAPGTDVTASRQSDPSFVPEGPGPLHTWSNGTDSRTRRSVADGTPINTWPFRAIGHFAKFAPAGGCTGTLIGRRTMLTSAHCVWDGDQIVQQDFNARSDPSNATPYGAAVTTNYIMPSGWFSESGCGSDNASPGCFAHDIAVVRLSQPIGDATGQMGFGAFGKATTQGLTTLMRGYPACAAPGAWVPAIPAGCTNAALYGDTKSCGAAQFKNAGCRGDNWWCTFDVKCDGSAGQSGSAVYAYNTPLGSSPVALGVYSNAECSGVFCGSNKWPNGITRITADVANMLAYWKSVWG